MALSVAILPWLNCALFVFFACRPSGESDAILLARLYNLARSSLASPLYLLTIAAEPVDHLSTLQTLSSLFVPEFLVKRYTHSYPRINIFSLFVDEHCCSACLQYECSVLLCFFLRAVVFQKQLSSISPILFHLHLCRITRFGSFSRHASVSCKIMEKPLIKPLFRLFIAYLPLTNSAPA